MNNSKVQGPYNLNIFKFQLVLQDSQVFQMMMMAQDMGVVELRTACEDHVISTLSVDNACTFLTAVMDIHEKAGKLLTIFLSSF